MIATRAPPPARPTGLKGDFSVSTHAFEAKRIDISSAKPFPFTLAALENRVPPADLPALTRLASSRAGPQGIEDAVQVMVGDYAPLRVSIYEADGRTHFTYDQPSGLLNQFDDEEIRAVGRILDDKVTALADYVLR